VRRVDYIEETFPYTSDPLDDLPVLDLVYNTSAFRIIPANEFVENFASDRSHMIVESSQIISAETEACYSAPPPSYAPLQGTMARKSGTRHNLMTDFVDMGTRGFGTIASLEEFRDWIWCTPSCIPHDSDY